MGERHAQEVAPGAVMWWTVLNDRLRPTNQERVEVVTILSGSEVEVRRPDGSYRRVLRHALRWQRDPYAPYRPSAAPPIQGETDG